MGREWSGLRWALGKLGLLYLEFSWGGFRAGNTTYRYLEDPKNLPGIQWHGRWLSARTLKHYTQEGTYFLQEIEWSVAEHNLVGQLADLSPAVLDPTNEGFALPPFHTWAEYCPQRSWR